MIRMIQSKSAGHAKAYFSDALTKSDYYIDEQERPGVLFGRLAERLGLGRDVSKETFFALCENVDPKTKKRLTPRTRDDRTVGYDINFHCPKSVSLLHALAKDEHILNAFHDSVAKTMKAIEMDGRTRVRKDGAVFDRPAGELIWAEFVHQTARPVGEELPDPHLHSHCFVFNMAWDEEEKRVKAGQFRDIKRDMPYYQALFHKFLSDRLMAEGYEIRRTVKSFEVVGVPQKVIGFFSKRTNEIGEVAKEKGITDPKALSELGARTRSKKQKGLSMTELKSHWQQKIRELTEAPEMNDAVRHGAKDKTLLTAQKCVDYSLLHSFERASVMDRRRLMETALRQSISHKEVTAKEIQEALDIDDRVIEVTDRGRKMCTTKEVLREEKEMVALARAGRGAMSSLYFAGSPPMKLEGKLLMAAQHVLGTRNRVAIIRGVAGSGKTTMMTETIRCIEDRNKKVTVLSPGAVQARQGLREQGFKDAQTVSKFLIDLEMQKATEKQVIWVDEAGLLGTKDMKALLAIATKRDARLILSGDTRQHASVVRGDALRILNTIGDIKVAEVSKIYRQRTEEYRSIVNDLASANIKRAFEKLDAMGAIREVDADNPYTNLADAYIDALKRRKTALVICPTHKEGEALTEVIRGRLRREKRLGRREIKVPRYINLNLTAAQKSDWRNYEAGLYVQFNQNQKNIKRGSLWEVNEIKGETIRITDAGGNTRTLQRGKANDFDVFAKSDLAVAKGDKIRICRPGFDNNKKRLENGMILHVESVSKNGALVLRNAKGRTFFKVPQAFGHIAHAHVITSHLAQGKTSDEVFSLQLAASFGATDGKQAYVTISRGREEAHIFTDDKQGLLEYASKMGDRLSASELVAEQPDLEHILTISRNAYQQKQKTKELEKQYSLNFKLEG